MNKLIKKMNEKQQREFALICASRAVDDVNISELNDYFTLICLGVESETLEEIKGTSEYRAAYWSAGWAADRAAYRAVEREIQKEIALNILDNKREENE
tara:strand:+ start:910 stop:1206 length:297 start_codon:yes stop_codon:yes gene_type:complete